MAFNAAEHSQPNYGAGLGTVYQYGHQMPAGPYSFLPNAQGGTGAWNQAGSAPGSAGGGARPATGGSTTTASSGPTASAESWMNDVLSGKNLPFSPQQIAAQTTQQTDMNAAAEHARNGQMDANAAAGGASASDPSFQGAKAANFARRQTDNSKAAGAITSQAGSANFGAQMQAAGQLNQNNMQREGWQHQGQGQASSFLPWNTPAGGQGKSPSYINFAGFQSGGNSNGQAPGSSGGAYPQANYGMPGMSQQGLDYRNSQQWQDDYRNNLPDANGFSNQNYYDMGL